MALLATGAQVGFRRALPFLFGVMLGKQLIIWPIGFGLMTLGDQFPWAFVMLKYISAAYIIWLAWRVTQMRLSARAAMLAPGFRAGLFVHPLNPKAWAMIIGGFTAFTAPQTSSLEATLSIALILLFCQAVLHPLWVLAGDAIARHLSGSVFEPYLMWTLGGLTVASVLFVLFSGAF